jgi:hypothetical protein
MSFSKRSDFFDYRQVGLSDGKLQPPDGCALLGRSGSTLKMKDKLVHTPAEIAEMTGLSRQTITRLFENEPGVLIITRGERLHTREYRSIRIPNAVYERVIRRFTVK